ncbi:hypothetical protein ACVHNB_13265 [Streptomyces sp. YJ-C3]
MSATTSTSVTTPTSVATPTCDHRVYHVVVVSLISVVMGLIVAIGFAALGQPPLKAAVSGGGVLAFVFAAGMSVVAHVSKRQ